MTTHGAGEGRGQVLEFQVSTMMADALRYVPEGLRGRVGEDLAALPRREAVQIVAGFAQYSSQMLERSQAGERLRREMPQHHTTLAAGLAAGAGVLASLEEGGAPDAQLGTEDVGDLNEILAMCRRSWEGLATFANC